MSSEQINLLGSSKELILFPVDAKDGPKKGPQKDLILFPKGKDKMEIVLGIPKREQPALVTVVDAKKDRLNNQSNSLQDSEDEPVYLKAEEESTNPKITKNYQKEQMLDTIQEFNEVSGNGGHNKPFRDVTRGILQQIFYEHRILMESLVQISYTFQFQNQDISQEKISQIFDLKLTDFRLELRTQLMELVDKNLIQNLAKDSLNPEKFMDQALMTYALVRKQVNSELKNGIGNLSDIREELEKEEQLLTADEDLFNLESHIATNRLHRDQTDQNLGELNSNNYYDTNNTLNHNVNPENNDEKNRKTVIVPLIKVHQMEQIEVIEDDYRIKNYGDVITIDFGDEDVQPYLEKQLNPLMSTQKLNPIQNARADSAKKSYASRDATPNSERGRHNLRDKLVDYVQRDSFTNFSRQQSKQTSRNQSPAKFLHTNEYQDTVRSPEKPSVFKTGPLISTERTAQSHIKSPSQLYCLSPETNPLMSKREQYSTERRRIHYSPIKGTSGTTIVDTNETVRNNSGVNCQSYFTGVPQCIILLFLT